jgi:outer membrane protein assembly factor BamB
MSLRLAVALAALAIAVATGVAVVRVRRALLRIACAVLALCLALVSLLAFIPPPSAPIGEGHVLVFAREHCANGDCSLISDVIALNAHDGSPHWRQTVPGRTITLAQSGGLIIVYSALRQGSSPFMLTGLRATDGAPAWQQTVQGFNELTAYGELLVGIILSDQRDVILVAVRARDGAEMWRAPLGTLGATLTLTNYSFVVGNGLIYAVEQDGTLLALRASDGYMVWSKTRAIRQSQAEPAYLIAGSDAIYVASGNAPFLVLRASDGHSLPRFQQLQARAPRARPVAERDGVLFLSDSIGIVTSCTLYAARESDGTLLWQQTLAQVNGCAVTLTAGDDLYVGGLDTLHALRRGEGTTHWRRRDDHRIFGPPQVIAGVLFAGSVSTSYVLSPFPDNNILALNPNDGSQYWSAASHTDLSTSELIAT